MKITRGNKAELVLCNNLAFMLKDISLAAYKVVFLLLSIFFLYFFQDFLQQDNIKFKNFSYIKIKKCLVYSPEQLSKSYSIQIVDLFSENMCYLSTAKHLCLDL